MNSFQKLIEFDPKQKVDPQDWSLAVCGDVDYRLVAIFTRLYYLNYLQDFGDQCVLIANVARRIIRLHGIEAHCQDAIMHFRHTERDWRQVVGAPENITHGGVIDTHRIVVTPMHIIDFAHRDSIHRTFGARAPRGFIVPRKYDFWHNTLMGDAKYVERDAHPMVKNITYQQRDQEKDLVSRYFDTYQM